MNHSLLRLLSAGISVDGKHAAGVQQRDLQKEEKRKEQVASAEVMSTLPSSLLDKE